MSAANVSGRISYRVGDVVRHARLGRGEVTATGEGRVVIRFGADERTFVPELAPLTKIGKADAGGVSVGQGAQRKHPTSVYGTSPIKRTRRTRAEIEALDEALVEIVYDFSPATVRQVFYQAVNRGLIPKSETKGYRVVQRRLVALREAGAVLTAPSWTARAT